MICPFIAGVRHVHKEITNEEGKTVDYLEIAQIPFYPECKMGECPFYDYNGFCLRADTQTSKGDY